MCPLNTYKKKKKKFDCKTKRKFFYLNFSSTATSKKTKTMSLYVNFISSTISILVNAMYFLFLLFANAHHDHELIRVKH